MKYRTQSANVLNEADRFDRMLNWQLFCMEQENRLFGYDPDNHWKPGDPIYLHPNTVQTSDCECADCIEEEGPLEGYYGHHVRPMIEVFDDGERYRYVRCKDCDVSWRGLEARCWVCGEERTRPEFESIANSGDAFNHNPVSIELESWAQEQLRVGVSNTWRELMNSQLQAYVSANADFTRRIAVSARRAGRAFQQMNAAFQGMSVNFVVTDEWRMVGRHTVELFNDRYTQSRRAPETEYRPLNSGYVANPSRSPFEKPEVVGPLWDTATFYDPLWGEPVGYAINRVQLPVGWAEQRAAIPLPEVPEPRDFAAEVDKVYWERLNPNYYRRDR